MKRSLRSIPRHIILVLAIALPLPNGRASGPPATASPTPARTWRFKVGEVAYYPCTVNIARVEALPEGELCWVNALLHRCNAGDRCLAECTLEGTSQSIAGGCFHTCRNILYPLDHATQRRVEKWSEPPEATACSPKQK
jgi:hypothetical protein